MKASDAGAEGGLPDRRTKLKEMRARLKAMRARVPVPRVGEPSLDEEHQT